MFWVLVHAHHAKGPYGADHLVVNDPLKDIAELDGVLIVNAQPTERARRARTLIYPAGEWTKVTVIEARNPGGLS